MKRSLNRFASVVVLAAWICLFSSRYAAAYQANSQTKVTSRSKDSSPSQKTAKLDAGAAQKKSSAQNQTTSAPAADSAPVVPGITAFDDPKTTVIRNGGSREIRLQLIPTTTPEQAAQQRWQTKNLLLVTDDNLKRISKLQLDANQQDMLEQVHNYIDQARSADQTGETQRAQTLASKARQLSDDLAGVRTFLKFWPW
jgi:hypothetical protein